MKAFRLIKILPYGMLLFSLIAFSGCSGNPMATSTPEEIEEGIANGEYVQLSKSSANQITRGKNVFETVMKKYQPVIDFYGADSEVFQKMVNTNLMMNAESLTSPSEKMFNYDSLSAWEDTEIVVVYEDGTKEALPSTAVLTIDGDESPAWYNNGKKITGYMVKLEKANDYVQKFAGKVDSLSEKLKSFDAINQNLDKFSEFLKTNEQLAGLCSTLEIIGNWAGYAGAVFSVIQMTGIIDFGPSADEVINMKLDYIIDMIKGMYTHLEYIEDRLDQIEQVIVVNFGVQIQLDLDSIKNELNSYVMEIEDAPTLDKKLATAEIFRNRAEALIADYITYSEGDYDNYVDYMANYAKDAEYSPVNIKIQIPHYVTASNNKTRIDCNLTDINMPNPTALIPFTYEGLEYFKGLIMTRLNLNTLVYTDKDTLDEYNSNKALTYIKGNAFLGKLRSEILSAYLLMAQELEKVNTNISSTEGCVKTNWDYCMSFISQHSNKYYWTSTTNGSYGITDSWNYIPWYSVDPNSYQLKEAWQCFGRLRFDFPYSPAITISANTPIEFTKAVTDPLFLDDTKPVIDAYYKAKTNRLLEFAASLAALEVQLALYLDDEDYAVYAQ